MPAESAIPLVPNTPSTASAVGTGVRGAVPGTAIPGTAPHAIKQREKRPAAAARWKAVKHKVHAYHNITHVVQHRAQEKIGFTVAEKCLVRVGEALTSRMTVPSTAVKAQGAGPKIVAALRKWLGALRRRVLRKRSQPVMTHRLPHRAAHHPVAVATSPLHHGLFALHVVMPAFGTYLLVHMAHDDVHRAQREWRQRRAVMSTGLFCLGALCDALDAAAHAVIVLCMLLDDGVFNHHLEHTLHAYSIYVAAVACVAMVMGEALSGDYREHAPKKIHTD